MKRVRGGELPTYTRGVMGSSRLSLGRRWWISLGFAAVSATAACSSEDPGTANNPGVGGQLTTGGSGASGGTPTGSGGETGGSGGGTGGDTPSGGTGGASAGTPQWLSETGLYQTDMATLASGVQEFQPQFPLWTDAAAKRRWVSIPAGTTIDTTDMDFWSYPVGTKLWKEFTRDGVRVETRLIEKRADGWFMMAYQWNEAQTDAEARPDGVQNASGTNHDIPSQENCEACHGKMKDRVLGFSALQLSHSGPGVTLLTLRSSNALSAPPAADFVVPGNATDQAALGYLHANCGHCHNEQSPLILTRTQLQLWLLTDRLDTVENTPTYQTAVGKAITATADPAPGADLIIAPGNSATSATSIRMNSRGTEYQMPPLGTEDVDADGLAAVQAWIQSLTPQAQPF